MEHQQSRNHTFERKKYPKETAGRLLGTKVPTVNDKATVNDVENLLAKETANFESINYIYILNPQKQLVGVISVKEVFRSPKTELVKNISPDKLITAHADTDQEKVALLALKNSIKAVPVIHKNNQFLGAVTFDTLLNILQSESVEDALRFAGAGKIENPAVSIIKANANLHFRKRFPWLLLGLLGGIVAALIVNHFETALKEELTLAAFIPAIVYMADAVGSQTQTIFIRSLALDHALDIKKYVLREFKVNVLLAALLGLLISAVCLVWLQSTTLSIILGTSIAATILAAMIIAISLPKLCQKLKIDPAIASGPFATVLRDITSLLIYFSIASLFL